MPSTTPRRFLPFATIALLLGSTANLRAQGTPVGFLEDFALATDRAKTLEQLIPGTAEHSYYQCLHLQQTGQFDAVPALLQAWIQRHGRSAQTKEIENRQALLTYARDPAATLRYVQHELGLRFDHQRVVSGTPPDLPTRLDPAVISLQTLSQRALQQRPGSVEGFTKAAYDFVVAMDLDDDRLMSLLSNVRQPDLPNLPALVVRNLGDRRSRGFGSLAIHKRLLLDQLEECARLRPNLLGDQAFLTEYLRRLRPSADVQWQRDPTARQAYLERLQAFVDRLPPAQNSLKAHVAYHRLRHDLATGKLDRDRLLAYLRLPRVASYANPRYLERTQSPRVDLAVEYATELGAVGRDDELVRACLAHFLRDADGVAPFDEVVEGDYLRRLFAETKILAGIGDMERWYSLLNDPAYYERLKDRVDIEFAPTQPTWFAADDPVAIEVDIKNVDTLLLRVFEIDTLNYYREVGKEVDASINLDGLVANVETTHAYDDGPLRRVRRRFDLPAVAAPGVYVVELIGKGTSSRAVIYKGRLQYTERLGAAGHALRVLDERGNLLRAARVWFGAREYEADQDGEITIPFSTKAGNESLILRHGSLATLTTLQHRGESYELRAGIHVDREALLARKTAKVLVHPQLLLNGQAVSLALVQQAILTLTATDVRGVKTSQEVRNFELFGDRESVHEFQVPDALASLSVALRGKVRVLTRDEDVDLAAPAHTFTVNEIDATEATACPLLARTAAGYVLELRGKEGEPLADRAVQLVLQHRLFTDPVHVGLKTDAQGRVYLGALDGITSVQTSGFPAGVGPFTLREAARTYPVRVAGVAGETLRVPYQGAQNTTSRVVASLLEVRDGAFVRDAFAKLALAEGFVELRGLEAGDYELWLKEADVRVEVRVTDGDKRDGWAVGRDRLLELGVPALHILAATVDADALTIRLANFGARARVHVVAGRYLAPFDPFGLLVGAASPTPATVAVEHSEATYHAGREIGEEYRYILERRFATRFPGNMLRRPSLLLNPWALDATDTSIGRGGGAAGKFGGRSGRLRAEAAPGGPSSPGPSSRTPGTFPNLDFLATPSTVLANLRVDADGVVRVKSAQLGDDQLVHVVAIDDGHTVYTTLAREEVPLTPRRRRLPAAIAADRHVTEQRRIEFLAAGASAVLADATSAKAQTYDSLAAVFQLYTTLYPAAELSRFAFVLGWPELAIERKRELYSQHACHELHFFLQRKDPAFFAAEVRPFLASKRDKTFLDHWLLEADLSPYLEPRAFARLNVVERILLVQRLPEVSDAVRRLVAETFDLLPPDLERVGLLFDSALESGALERSGELRDKLGALHEMVKNKAEGRVPLDRAVPERPSAAAAEPDAAQPEEEQEVVEGAKVDDFARRALADEKDLGRREQMRRLFRAPDPTRRYVEHNYWHRPIAEQNAELVTVNGFWRDYAVADRTRPFSSASLAEASRSFAEMMLALSVLDLPFQAGEHKTSVDGQSLTLEAASPLLLVRKEIVDSVLAKDAAPILVNQNFFRLDARYTFVGNERRDAYVSGEFLVGVAYGCQVVVTNPTSAPRKLDLLLQIPQGAIAVRAGVPTRGVPVALDAYGTTSVDYAFYFPVAGRQPHYPVHVAEQGKLVAFAPPRTLDVVTELSQVDTTSWDYVAQNGTPAEVLSFLDGANVLRLDLGKIAWRMRDQTFYAATIGRLRQRLVYDDGLWAYALLHRDEPAIREYLRHADEFLAACGRALESPLVDIDPVERRAYQHVEFDPLFNPRAHRFGKTREILNQALAQQYFDYLGILAARDTLDATDWLGVTYYLLLQDRVEEALASFARVEVALVPTRVQYDYARAYLDFFTADHALARGIAERYREYPIPHWRARFAEVLQQLDEAEGKARPTGPARDDAALQQGVLAATEPALELAVEARRVTVRYRNVDQCQVSYYRMDVEFLFSTHPFVQQGDSAFAYIRANRAETRALPAGGTELAFDLPAEFGNANVLVEVRSKGLTRRQAYYANSLTTHFVESYGQVRVSESAGGKPLPRVYVKVFARSGSGHVRFHKDGYTDLRGRFDYASLSGDNRGDIERFAVLVLSDDRGAMIREVPPPQQ